MRFRQIKVGQVVVTTNNCQANMVDGMGMVGEVIEKRVEGDSNLIDIRDADGAIHSALSPKDISHVADSTVEANFREEAGESTPNTIDAVQSQPEIWVGADGSEMEIIKWLGPELGGSRNAHVKCIVAGTEFSDDEYKSFTIVGGITHFTKKVVAAKPNVVRVVRYVRPKCKNEQGRVSAIGNKGITLVIDINHEKKELTIYHAECNGETFCKQRGIEEALKKTPEVFPYNPNHTLVGHVAYIVTKAKRRSMKRLAQLREQMTLAMATRRLA